MQVEERIPIVKVLRFCRRCERWRSIGNFSVNRQCATRVSLGTVCHLCWTRGGPNAKRRSLVVIDLGRATVAEMAAAS